MRSLIITRFWRHININKLSVFPQGKKTDGEKISISEDPQVSQLISSWLEEFFPPGNSKYIRRKHINNVIKKQKYRP